MTHAVSPHHPHLAHIEHHSTHHAPESAPATKPGKEQQQAGRPGHPERQTQQGQDADALDQTAIEPGHTHHQQHVEAKQQAIVLGRHAEVIDIDIGRATDKGKHPC